MSKQPTTDTLHKTINQRPLTPRQRQIDNWARDLEKALVQRGQAFDLEQVIDHELIVDPDAEEEVLERTYHLALDRVWQDLQVTDDERAALAWVAGALELSPERTHHLNTRYGIIVFERFLAKAISDGRLDHHEIQTLKTIARGVGADIGRLMNLYFSKESERFLRGMFLTMTQDGHLGDKEWQQLLNTTQALGLSQEQLLDSIQSQAEKFVEHVLADAKADGRLDTYEKQTLCWLMEHLKLSESFRQYVTDEMDTLQTLTEIASGLLPRTSPPKPLSNPNEIVHYHGPGHYEVLIHLPSGPKYETHDGYIVITDSHLRFSSDDQQVHTPHYRVTRIGVLRHGVNIRTMDGDDIIYDFTDAYRQATAIYLAAVRQANPPALEAEPASRHTIDQDTRQLIWQRYNGSCADCGATSSLEFDYIIPIAKGGDNTEANLCLVCPRCRLAKSDVF